MAFSNIFVVCCFAAVVNHAFAHPATDKPKPESNVGNLKYTFGSKDEIPSAFFESEPLKKSNATREDSSPNQERPVYPACQDGSGGMCVPIGSCPTHLKPDTNEPGACANAQECCFGAPAGDRSCLSRGGECRKTQECGGAPTFLEAEDCDQKNDQICCILVT